MYGVICTMYIFTKDNLVQTEMVIDSKVREVGIASAYLAGDPKVQLRYQGYLVGI